MTLSNKDYADLLRERTDGNARLSSPVEGAPLLMELTTVKALWDGVRDSFENPPCIRIRDGRRVEEDAPEAAGIALSALREVLDDIRPKLDAVDIWNRDADEETLRARVFLTALGDVVAELEGLLEPAPAQGF